MANSVQILAKFARDAGVLGLTVVSQSQSSVVIQDGGATLTLSYANALIQLPMGGVSNSVSPYLGIGVGNPGQLILTSSNTGGAVADVIDSASAAQVLQLLSGFANDIYLADATSPVVLDANGAYASGGICRLRGSSDWIGMGQ